MNFILRLQTNFILRLQTEPDVWKPRISIFFASNASFFSNSTGTQTGQMRPSLSIPPIDVECFQMFIMILCDPLEHLSGLR